MEEGKYSIQFANDEMISVHYYDGYYDNRRNGRMVVKEFGQNETPHLISSEAPSMTEYIFRPQHSRLLDCVEYILNPPYLDNDVSVGNISCDLYKNILLDSSSRSLFRSSKSDEMFADLCTWNWNKTENAFHISINNSYQRLSRYIHNSAKDHAYKESMKMAFSCNLRVIDRTNHKNLQHSRFLSFVIPFVHNPANGNKISDKARITNMKSKRTALPPNSSKWHHIIAIGVCSMIIMIGAAALVLLYRYKEKHKR